MKYAIFINRWNKDETKLFDNLQEAQAEWDKICNHRHALITNKGKDVSISDPRQGGVGYIYSKVHYQKSWD